MESRDLLLADCSPGQTLGTSPRCLSKTSSHSDNCPIALNLIPGTACWLKLASVITGMAGTAIGGSLGGAPNI